MLSLMKVAEHIDGKICMAMETIDAESCVCFLFSSTRDFQLNIGVAGVGF